MEIRPYEDRLTDAIFYGVYDAWKSIEDIPTSEIFLECAGVAYFKKLEIECLMRINPTEAIKFIKGKLGDTEGLKAIQNDEDLAEAAIMMGQYKDMMDNIPEGEEWR